MAIFFDQLSQIILSHRIQNQTIEFINKKTVFKNGFTYNILSKSRVSAIIPVHVYGNAAWMDELIPLCEERNIPYLFAPTKDKIGEVLGVQLPTAAACIIEPGESQELLDQIIPKLKEQTSTG